MTVIRNRLAWLGGRGASPFGATANLTTTSGRMPASSQASRALSTASLTQVSNAFRGLSKPSKWRFLVKNSETDIYRCRAPISAADTATLGSGGCVSATAALDFSIGLDMSFGSVVRLLFLLGMNAVAGCKKFPAVNEFTLSRTDWKVDNCRLLYQRL